MTVLSSIHTYPIKSCAGIAHDEAPVQRRGLMDDRRWLITTPDGRFITGRQKPELVCINVSVHNHSIVLSAADAGLIEIAKPGSRAKTVDVTVWRDAVKARHAGPKADEWLSDYLGEPVQLVYQGDDDQRVISAAAGGADGDHVSFADAYPLLLIGSASLEALNAKLDVAVGMNRFRTNLVAATREPFVEDNWRCVRIGSCLFDVVKRCARCVFTTVDPSTGIKDTGGEPLKTLRSFRLDKQERGVMFGVNLIPRQIGVLRVGQTVEVVEQDLNDDY